MVLHIGNNRVIPWRDIIAVLDVKALRRAQGTTLADLDKNLGSARSVIVYEADGETVLCGSPISATALSMRSRINA